MLRNGKGFSGVLKGFHMAAMAARSFVDFHASCHHKILAAPPELPIQAESTCPGQCQRQKPTYISQNEFAMVGMKREVMDEVKGHAKIDNNKKRSEACSET